jgi:hypothetical protein
MEKFPSIFGRGFGTVGKTRLPALIPWFLGGMVWAQDPEPPPARVEIATTANLQEAVEPAPAVLPPEALGFADMARTIGLGREEYRYGVEWGILKVGKATLGSPEVVVFDGTAAYRIVSTARSLPFFDAFHRVRDRSEAWLDTRLFRSLGFGSYLREGRVRKEMTMVFDHESGRFKATIRKKNGTVVQEEGPLKPLAYDVLSALYWVRAQTLAKGMELTIDVNSRKDWPLRVLVHKRERVRVPAGDFDAWVVEPLMREEGIFVHKGKSMKIWMTTDSRKIPVQLSAEVAIGSVRAQLEEIVYKE